jgi:site-specific recombinase XerD
MSPVTKQEHKMNPSIPLSEAAQLYLEHLEQLGKHKRTISTYYRDLQQVQAFFGAERLVNNIPLPLIGRFLKSNELLLLKNGQPRASQTVNKTIRVFRMFMLWLSHQGHITELHLPKSVPWGRNKP